MDLSEDQDDLPYEIIKSKEIHDKVRLRMKCAPNYISIGLADPWLNSRINLDLVRAGERRKLLNRSMRWMFYMHFLSIFSTISGQILTYKLNDHPFSSAYLDTGGKYVKLFLFVGLIQHFILLLVKLRFLCKPSLILNRRKWLCSYYFFGKWVNAYSTVLFFGIVTIPLWTESDILHY